MSAFRAALVAPVVAPILVTALGTLAVACEDPPAPPPTPRWAPGLVYPSEPGRVRGFLDVRGLIHAHSVYSHDACDEKPVDENGVRDAVCFDDFRRGLCQAKHDFVFLTDHRDSFNATELPEALLYRAERGDVLVERDGGATANLAACPDGTSALIMAGNEGEMMPVGLERHAAATPEARDAIYGARTPEAAAAMHDNGAVVLLSHPEDYSVDDLKSFPVDGFENYNLHANTLLGAGTALSLLLRVQQGDTGVPHPDLFVLSIWSEDPVYLNRWGNVLASGKRVVSTMGTDCHRNTFTALLADGERVDSYRRMMIAFSNHLRVRPAADGSVDDRALKEALAAGRNYGAFEMLGYPVGFDVVAEADGAFFEMGETVPLGARLRVARPRVKNLDPSREPPRITVRVLRATESTEGFVEVASSSDEVLEVPLEQAGAWRAEVRMLPLHLREDLGDDDLTLLDEFAAQGKDYVWIYGGPLYVQ